MKIISVIFWILERLVVHVIAFGTIESCLVHFLFCSRSKWIKSNGIKGFSHFSHLKLINSFSIFQQSFVLRILHLSVFDIAHWVLLWWDVEIRFDCFAVHLTSFCSQEADVWLRDQWSIGIVSCHLCVVSWKRSNRWHFGKIDTEQKSHTKQSKTSKLFKWYHFNRFRC